jgi:hypothetical protein
VRNSSLEINSVSKYPIPSLTHMFKRPLVEIYLNELWTNVTTLIGADSTQSFSKAYSVMCPNRTIRRKSADYLWKSILMAL